MNRQNLTSVDGQILMTKVDRRTVRVKIFLMAVDLYHRYSNFKLKKNTLVSIVYTKIFQRFNLLTAKLFNLNFHPPEVVSR